MVGRIPELDEDDAFERWPHQRAHGFPYACAMWPTIGSGADADRRAAQRRTPGRARRPTRADRRAFPLRADPRSPRTLPRAAHRSRSKKSPGTSRSPARESRRGLVVRASRRRPPASSVTSRPRCSSARRWHAHSLRAELRQPAHRSQSPPGPPHHHAGPRAPGRAVPGAEHRHRLQGHRPQLPPLLSVLVQRSNPRLCPATCVASRGPLRGQRSMVTGAWSSKWTRSSRRPPSAVT